MLNVTLLLRVLLKKSVRNLNPLKRQEPPPPTEPPTTEPPFIPFKRMIDSHQSINEPMPFKKRLVMSKNHEGLVPVQKRQNPTTEPPLIPFKKRKSGSSIHNPMLPFKKRASVQNPTSPGWPFIPFGRGNP